MMEFEYAKGATPLNPEEIKGLIPTHITKRKELDFWEQENINEALAWIEQRRPKNILNEKFIRQLHKKMFCDVWKWAGKFRKNDKNLGVSWHQIPVELKQLYDNTEYWIEHETFSPDETAARLHHKLVWIHPFPNGNGRHARLMADTLLEFTFGKPPFTWGSADLIKSGRDRSRYIESLQAADNEDYSMLMEFVRS